MFIVKTFEFFWRVARYNGGFDDLNMLVFCLAQISPQIRICQLKLFDAVITWCLAHSSPPSLISLILLTINLGFFLQILVRFQTYCFDRTVLTTVWDYSVVNISAPPCKAWREKWRFFYIIKILWSVSLLDIKLIITRLTITLKPGILLGLVTGDWLLEILSRIINFFLWI